jgi:hypothetical protein
VKLSNHPKASPELRLLLRNSFSELLFSSAYSLPIYCSFDNKVDNMAGTANAVICWDVDVVVQIEALSQVKPTTGSPPRPWAGGRAATGQGRIDHVLVDIYSLQDPWSLLKDLSQFSTLLTSPISILCASQALDELSVVVCHLIAHKAVELLEYFILIEHSAYDSPLGSPSIVSVEVMEGNNNILLFVVAVCRRVSCFDFC